MLQYGSITILIIWGFPEMVMLCNTPKCLVYHGKSQSRMDDDWGYRHDYGNPHFGCVYYVKTTTSGHCQDLSCSQPAKCLVGFFSRVDLIQSVPKMVQHCAFLMPIHWCIYVYTCWYMFVQLCKNIRTWEGVERKPALTFLSHFSNRASFPLLNSRSPR